MLVSTTGIVGETGEMKEERGIMKRRKVNRKMTNNQSTGIECQK
jgi:hypothetical protein